MRWMSMILGMAGLLALESCMESSGREASSPADWNRELAGRLAYLVKDSTLSAQIELSRSGLMVYASVEDKIQDKPEFQLDPEEYPAFLRLSERLSPEELLKVYMEKGTSSWPEDSLSSWAQPGAGLPVVVDSLRPLVGFRIALDPGHMAAEESLAELEGKFVKMRPSSQTGQQEIFLLEPNLTLATAHLLREMLEDAGATVAMTRTEPGIGAMGLTFSAWRKEHFLGSLKEALALQVIDSVQAQHLMSPEATEKEIFNWLFNQLDLRARAEQINAFQPDLTLIIHYNVDSPNWMKRDDEGFLTPGDANYNMAFVPGGFMKGELANMEDRVAFLRILFSKDWDRSVALSDRVLKRFSQKLQVPSIKSPEGLSYLQNAAIPTASTGVYARNLTLTRMVKGPLCYGESLCQDHRAEIRILNRRDLLVNGLPVSHRVKEVAEAYFEGVLDFVRMER